MDSILAYRGDFVMEYVGEVLDYKQFKSRVKQQAKMGQEHHYFMALNSDEVIDASYKGNVSRYMNHSCDPNCETQKVGHIILYTIWHLASSQAMKIIWI